MKNRLHTGFIMTMILIMLFCVSFYSFLQTKTKEKEHDGYEYFQEQLQKELVTNSLKENVLTKETKITLVDMGTKNQRSKSSSEVNVNLNSNCLEMGFTEFRQYLETHKMEVLTEKVYELEPYFDAQTDSVIILTFNPKNVVLGISCGKNKDQKIKSNFEYFAIVDSEKLMIYSWDELNHEQPLIFMECKISDYYFPKEMRLDLENGIYFKSEKELYNFLESYSS